MRDYELMLILHPDVDSERMAVVFDRIRRVISNSGGDIIEEENWGKKRLAFKIANQTDANYHIVAISMDPSVSAELENSLNLLDDVIRHMLIRQEEVAV